MQNRRYTSAVPNELKILTTISFFASGSYQRVIGQDFTFGMSQPMISRSIAEVTDVFVNHLLHEHIEFPQNNEEFERIKVSFFEKFNMGGIIGTIDGTHIAINAPKSK